MSAIDNLRAVVGASQFEEQELRAVKVAAGFERTSKPGIVKELYAELSFGDLREILAALDHSESAVCSCSGSVEDSIYADTMAAVDQARNVLQDLVDLPDGAVVNDARTRIICAARTAAHGVASRFAAHLGVPLCGRGVRTRDRSASPPHEQVLDALELAGDVLWGQEQRSGRRLGKGDRNRARMAAQRIDAALVALTVSAAS